MSERKFLIPEFGPFAGMRIITSGSASRPWLTSVQPPVCCRPKG